MSALYEHAFRRVLFPAYETGLRRRKTLPHLSAYERDQWLPAEQIAALQWQRLKTLLDHCYRNVPYYRRRWQELGVTPADIHNLSDYAQLPVLGKADIRENFDDLKADGQHDALLYKTTGGSTGEPMRFGYTRDNNERRTAVMWRGYAWAGSRMGRRTLYLWGRGLGNTPAAQQWKDHLFNAMFGRRMLNSFAMSEATMATYADAIDRYRPDIIVGYVGPLVKLSQWLLANGRTIWRPKSMITGAEALHDFQRDIIEQAFDAPVFNTYGCREVMLIAAECEKRNGLHINADHLLVELCPLHGIPAQADSGHVVITDLFNFGMPLLRYANGDMATIANGACKCGRGLPRLARVEGRVLDAIRTSEGQILPGEFFPHMLKDVPGVERFQLVQRELDRIDLSIVRADGFTDDSLAYIHREITKVLGDGIDLRYHFPDDIPLTPSGKLRVTVSELAP